MSIRPRHVLAIMEACGFGRKMSCYMQIYRLRLTIFRWPSASLVTGIVSPHSNSASALRVSPQTAGPAIGPLIALEVPASFFLGSGCSWNHAFRLNRVGKRLHWFATCRSLWERCLRPWILSQYSGCSRRTDSRFENGRLSVTMDYVIHQPFVAARACTHMLMRLFDGQASCGGSRSPIIC